MVEWSPGQGDLIMSFIFFPSFSIVDHVNYHLTRKKNLTIAETIKDYSNEHHVVVSESPRSRHDIECKLSCPCGFASCFIVHEWYVLENLKLIVPSLLLQAQILTQRHPSESGFLYAMLCFSECLINAIAMQ